MFCVRCNGVLSSSGTIVFAEARFRQEESKRSVILLRTTADPQLNNAAPYSGSRNTTDRLRTAGSRGTYLAHRNNLNGQLPQ